MYTDASSQQAIDENVPNNEQDFISDKEDNKRSYQNTIKDLIQVLEEEKSEETGDIPKDVREGARRSSGVSNFNDIDCGEPAMGQHLRINFACTEEDNIEIENKCRSFWKFIDSHPHLKQIKVWPRNNTESTSSEDAVLKKIVSRDAEKTAVQWMGHDNIMKSAMRTKFKTTYCELDRGDYYDRKKSKNRESKIRSDGSRGFVEGDDSKLLSGRSRAPSADKLKTICQCMDEWDAAHPGCMDPPRHHNLIGSKFRSLSSL